MLSKERKAWLLYRLSISETWIPVFRNQIILAELVGDSAEIARLEHELQREKQLYNGLKRAIDTNQDTFIVL